MDTNARNCRCPKLAVSHVQDLVKAIGVLVKETPSLVLEIAVLVLKNAPLVKRCYINERLPSLYGV